ncbi:hypothetical protein CRE_02658 [Caenorhabditis remanei]|uniref:Uncharacterized protein n=1 Tax=Caenorhabditis remanei TaxID=31234 RepID=E3NG26_CAERE|nr:hypothetical protein CRE_02658 [Caenorhabditis remanei]
MQYSAYFLLFCPIFLNCRVNIVSCYFYWTHPYFKKKTSVTSSFTIKHIIMT